MYGELRSLPPGSLAQQRSPARRSRPRARVHEAYLRLVGGGDGTLGWNSRNHFFTAAAEAASDPDR
ncbi:MAG: ECF-type sigma factor [Isosphaeraceae bacterium]